MAYTMKGSPRKLGTIEGTSTFKDRKIKKAKRLVRKNVANVVHENFGGTTGLSERKQKRSERKIDKAVDILRSKGYSTDDIETITGSHGIEPALEWAKKKKKKKKKK